MKNIKINVDCFKKSAMFMAGFSLYQCLRIALTASSFALKRFGIPRRNVDIFITKIHNSMEVAIFLGILIATMYIVLIPGKHARFNGIVSIFTNWMVCLMFFVVLVAFGGNGDKGNLTMYYWGLVGSGFAMGMNQSIAMAVSVENISYFAGSIPLAGVQVSVYHILFLYLNKGRPNYDVNYWILVHQIIMAIIISGVAAILWTIGFIEDHKMQLCCEEEGEDALKEQKVKIVILDSSEKDEQISQEEKRSRKKSERTSQLGAEAEEEDENVQLGKKGLKELIRRSTQFLQINFKQRSRRSRERSSGNRFSPVLFLKGVYKAISPIMMSTVAMGLVYLVFPAIAPYRLTNLDTGHKIDIVILITFVAPALINIALCALKVGPNCDWAEYKFWNYTWVFAVPYFACIIMFFIPAHYPEAKFSQLMRSSKYMLGFVCFTFALSHAVLKTVGFTGAGVQNTIKPVVITNTDLDLSDDSIPSVEGSHSENGATTGSHANRKSRRSRRRGSGPQSPGGKGRLRPEPRDNSLNGQVSSFNILLSYLMLVIFAFIGDGYLKTLKACEANRALWPTANMSFLRSLAFWVSMAFRRGLRSFGEVFTLNVREQLMK
ncbi:conserved hypothetical protein [Theileria orientalis strain Shintoku]|uniref:Uncharacterized protein n=1 Tax=Theileria orientalis strain Shintoku TaxID=869250 RepID=J4C804_THEOR|nr:conserved hypothetical protein [Theileria orientalis strain Shintoku]PVC53061.1 hypothetical protein MACL_00000326 [Theileria orientalis]BAM39943.1 conserved hypothetical protein [Theileria orientalis strain Shintoku]|eukprot:XP_009690244.1 conserved hypothetical protein [Theileria orientalis strain Shintoku]